MKNLLLIGLSLLLLFACHEIEPVEGVEYNYDNIEYLIVTDLHSNILVYLDTPPVAYKLFRESLYKGVQISETEWDWQDKGSQFEWDTYPMEDLALIDEVITLENQFPDYLYHVKSTAFGCSEYCNYGFLVEYKINGVPRRWLLNRSIELNPKEIQPWAKSLESLLLRLDSE